MFKRWFFNLVYLLLLLVLSPVLFYRMLKQGKYRRGFKQKYFGRIPRRERVLHGKKRSKNRPARIVWFHAVSVGEVNLLRPILKRIEDTHSDWCCVISTTSATGMELARKLFGERYTVFYCPLDFSWAVEKAMQRLRPDMLVLAEQELWPNLVEAATRHDVKLAVINGRMSESGYKRYRWIRPLVASMLRRFDGIAVQSETYAGWFHHLGASSDRIRITGSMKFDGARSDRDNPETQRCRTLAGIADTDLVFLAGSTQSPEEAMAVDVYENLKADVPELRLILVPRHPERFDDVAAMLEEKGLLWERRSLLRPVEASSEASSDLPIDASAGDLIVGESTRKSIRPRILLVDTVGELGAWWGAADIAFVGGSMGSRGGQNMIEPAAYGAAVCFGPNTRNFRDIVDLMLRNDAARVVHDQREMEQFVRLCLTDRTERERLGTQAGELVRRQLGATDRTLAMLEELLPQTTEK